MNVPKMYIDKSTSVLIIDTIHKFQFNTPVGLNLHILLSLQITRSFCFVSNLGGRNHTVLADSLLGLVRVRVSTR